MGKLINPRRTAVKIIQITEIIALKAFLASDEGEAFLEHYCSCRHDIKGNVDIRYRNSSDSFLLRTSAVKNDIVNRLLIGEKIFAIISQKEMGVLSRTLIRETQETPIVDEQQSPILVPSFKTTEEEREDTINMSELEQPFVVKRLELYRDLVNRNK